MKRKLALLVVAGLALASGFPGLAGPDQVKGPAGTCVDITGGSGSYEAAAKDDPLTPLVNEAHPARVTLRLDFDVPTCTDATYTMYVLDGPGMGNGVSFAIQAKAGDGAADAAGRGHATFEIHPADFTKPDGTSQDDPTVCVFATTSLKHPVDDRAPDKGCNDLSTDVPGIQIPWG